MRAGIPRPLYSQPSSTITQRFVFWTDRRIGASSSGRSVRGSMISHDTPSASSCSAAFIATLTIFDHATIVTSVPSRFTSATPIGTRYSPSGTSPFEPYSVSPSKKITGSSSRIADFSRPFAS